MEIKGIMEDRGVVDRGKRQECAQLKPKPYSYCDSQEHEVFLNHQ